MINSVRQFIQFLRELSGGVSCEFNGVFVSLVAGKNVYRILLDPDSNIPAFKFEYVVLLHLSASIVNDHYQLSGYVCRR